MPARNDSKVFPLQTGEAVPHVATSSIQINLPDPKGRSPETLRGESSFLYPFGRSIGAFKGESAGAGSAGRSIDGGRSSTFGLPIAPEPVTLSTLFGKSEGRLCTPAHPLGKVSPTQRTKPAENRRRKGVIVEGSEVVQPMDSERRESTMTPRMS